MKFLTYFTNKYFKFFQSLQLYSIKSKQIIFQEVSSLQNYFFTFLTYTVFYILKYMDNIKILPQKKKENYWHLNLKLSKYIAKAKQLPKLKQVFFNISQHGLKTKK